LGGISRQGTPQPGLGARAGVRAQVGAWAATCMSGESEHVAALLCLILTLSLSLTLTLTLALTLTCTRGESTWLLCSARRTRASPSSWCRSVPCWRRWRSDLVRARARVRRRTRIRTRTRTLTNVGGGRGLAVVSLARRPAAWLKRRPWPVAGCCRGHLVGPDDVSLREHPDKH
jgi:hypothetical protein